MISSSSSDSEKKVPLLGDIPIIGNLFKSKSNASQRKEIVVFITPHVLETPEDIAKISEASAEAIDSKGLWPNGWVTSDMSRHIGQSAGIRADRTYMRADRRTHRDDLVPADTNAPLSGTVEKGPTATVDPDLQSFIQSQDQRQTP